jgi:hypothetical protein
MPASTFDSPYIIILKKAASKANMSDVTIMFIFIFVIYAFVNRLTLKASYQAGLNQIT